MTAFCPKSMLTGKLLIPIGLLLGACDGSDARHDALAISDAPASVSAPPAPLDAPGKASVAPPNRIEQEIPGAAFKVEFVLVPGSADGSIAPFYMSTREITWEAFDVYVYRLDQRGDAPPTGADAISRPSKPYLPPDRGFGHAGYAAIAMSHHNAAEFCKWLSAYSGRTFRLPAETEWEHACGAGSSGEYCFGDDPAQLGDYAWYAANAEDKPHPTGAKKANAFGLFDMHGNVAEWCDGSDGKPVVLGGSYLDPADKVRDDARMIPAKAWNASDPQIPKSKWWLADAPFVGFRVVCAVDGAEKDRAETAH